jgi:hypothetical protein
MSGMGLPSPLRGWTPPGLNARADSLPAPIGGWNARDALANMDPMDAVILQNFYPTPSNVVLRGGSTPYATGMTGQIGTLLNYNSGSTEKFFAIDSSYGIFDISSGGAVGSAVVSGLSNNYWEYTNITTPGGGYMLLCNGVDSIRRFDGTTWLTITGTGTGAITGVTTSTIDNIILFQNRIWMVQKNTLVAWYLGTSSVAGAASTWDLTGIARRGGYIVDVGVWTIDAGYGVNDNLVFITSNGEVIVYQGTDPSSASTFALIGVWQLGSPIGHRCMIKYGGDILILNYDGLLPLAEALQSSRLDPRVALTNKIQGAITNALQSYSTGPTSLYWQIFYYPLQNAIILNVPISASGQQQYVMNTITKSWCNFTNWQANVFELYQDQAYFGANGMVFTAWDGTYADSGVSTLALGLQAFNYFGERGTIKYFTRMRPNISTNGQPIIYANMNTDFNIVCDYNPISYYPQTSGEWGSALWGSGMWGSGLINQANWQGVNGIGYCGAVQFKTQTAGIQIQWAATDIVFQNGWQGI